MSIQNTTKPELGLVHTVSDDPCLSATGKCANALDQL